MTLAPEMENYAGMFTNLTDLHCTIKSRVEIGNTVIDEEQVETAKANLNYMR